MTGDDVTAVAVLAAVLATGLSVTGRLIYRNARDLAVLAQRVAFLEGRKRDDRTE